MSEVDYLTHYYKFDDDVLSQVERAAHQQALATWPEYKARHLLPETQIFTPKDSKPIEVIDIRPKDYDDVVVYHQPMACILDSNRQIHVATLQAVLPDKRVIGIGNPGQPGHGYGKLSIAEALKVAGGNLEPTVSAALEYLHQQKLESAIHAGESYGADKAVSAAENSAKKDLEAVTSLAIEPVSVAEKGLIKMGLTFMRTGKRAENYLSPLRAVSHAFVSAEQLRESPLTYALGLARLSNLAVGAALGKSGFKERLKNAMSANEEFKAGIAWGTASEFDTENEREQIVENLINEFGEDRISAMPLKGQTHAMNLDPLLNSAIYAQLLKNIDLD
jgi:hypothetical protein